MEYKIIRSHLQAYLHQDYDLDSQTVPKAIYDAIADSDEHQALLVELEALAKEEKNRIKEVLGDHDVEIFTSIDAIELLTTLTTMTKLWIEEKHLQSLNQQTKMKT